MPSPRISIALSAVARLSGPKIESLREEVVNQIAVRCPEYLDGSQKWPMRVHCDAEEIGPVFVMEFARRVFKVTYKPSDALWHVELGQR